MPHPTLANAEGEDHLQPCPKTRSGFRLFQPYRLEDVDHVFGGDVLHVDVAELIHRVGLDRVHPLLGVLGVSPMCGIATRLNGRQVDAAKKMLTVASGAGRSNRCWCFEVVLNELLGNFLTDKVARQDHSHLAGLLKSQWGR